MFIAKGRFVGYEEQEASVSAKNGRTYQDRIISVDTGAGIEGIYFDLEAWAKLGHRVSDAKLYADDVVLSCKLADKFGDPIMKALDFEVLGAANGRAKATAAASSAE